MSDKDDSKKNISDTSEEDIDSDDQQEDSQEPQFHDDDITLFAKTNYRGVERRFGIKRTDRRRHMYVIGKTGMGKSTLLENMIIQDIQNGNGLAVVDPHGDLVEKVLHYIPANRINDVVYFNPSDIDNPIAFNILEHVDAQYKHLVSNGLVGVFKKIWADSWGPRLEYILINTILALLEYPGATLLGVTRMLVDDKYRKRIVKNISDPVVRSFWIDEYNNYTEKFRNEAIAPIQNKVGQFLSSSLIRNIVGQARSTIYMREIMDSRKILLMNLSKGRIGEENASLLGAMMITKLQLAAMSRVDIPEPERKDFYLYVDEFQNFATESFAGILSEARKYRLNLTMAHQYIEQLSDEVKAAVFGNVGTMTSFRVGATDAEELEKEFAPVFTQEDIVTLPAYHIYLRLMIDGVASDPFSATTLSPLEGETNNKDKVIRVSRERYGKDRLQVEEKILRWSGMDQAQIDKHLGKIDSTAEEDNDEADTQEEESETPPPPPQAPEPVEEAPPVNNTFIPPPPPSFAAPEPMNMDPFGAVPQPQPQHMYPEQPLYPQYNEDQPQDTFIPPAPPSGYTPFAHPRSAHHQQVHHFTDEQQVSAKRPAYAQPRPQITEDDEHFSQDDTAAPPKRKRKRKRKRKSNSDSNNTQNQSN